jgi:hypothetical protein
MKRVLVLAAFMVAFTGMVDAKQATLRGGVCFATNFSITDANRKWICEYFGRATIKEIYERGFRVVSAYTTRPGQEPNQPQYLIIEEQGK